MSSHSDQNARWSRLMKEAQEGNKQSYETLLREISKVINAFVRMRIHDASHAEDIAQEVLISIHKARHTYDPERQFTSWMFAIAKYKLIDHLRKAKRSTQKEINDDEFLENLAQVEEDEELITIRENLHVAIEKLPEKQRTAVRMLKLEGLSVKEVSDATGMSESAVKVTAHRAYKALKKRLLGASI